MGGVPTHPHPNQNRDHRLLLLATALIEATVVEGCDRDRLVFNNLVLLKDDLATQMLMGRVIVCFVTKTGEGRLTMPV